jgi:hypothetical protein
MPRLSAVSGPEEAVFHEALDMAGIGTDPKAYLAERAPDYDPSAHVVYHEAAEWKGPHSERDRIRVYTAFSAGKSAVNGAAWNQAVDAAMQLGPDFRIDQVYHPLEDVIAPQTDPARLEEAGAIADTISDPVLRARSLRAVAVRQAAIGEMDRAETTIQRISPATETPSDPNVLNAIQRQVDNARVAVVGGWASHDTYIENNETVAALSKLDTRLEVKPMALIKVAARIDGSRNSTRWEQVDEDMPSYWHGYKTDERVQVVDDLIGAGQLERASRYAFALDYTGDAAGTPPLREIWTDKVIEVARAQAAVDPGQGLATLAKLRGDISVRLEELSGYRSVGAPHEQRQAQQEELYTYLDRITGHEVAIQRPVGVQQTMKMLNRASFRSSNQLESQERAIGTVAVAMSQNDELPKALELVRRIGWYPTENGIKSKTLTDVGRAAYDYRTARGI